MAYADVCILSRGVKHADHLHVRRPLGSLPRRTWADDWYDLTNVLGRGEPVLGAQDDRYAGIPSVSEWLSGGRDNVVSWFPAAQPTHWDADTGMPHTGMPHTGMPTLSWLDGCPAARAPTILVIGAVAVPRWLKGATLGQRRRGSSLGFCRQRELRLKDTGMPIVAAPEVLA